MYSRWPTRCDPILHGDLQLTTKALASQPVLTVVLTSTETLMVVDVAEGVVDEQKREKVKTCEEDERDRPSQQI